MRFESRGLFLSAGASGNRLSVPRQREPVCPRGRSRDSWTYLRTAVPRWESKTIPFRIVVVAGWDGDLEMGRVPCQPAQLSHKWLFNGWKDPRHFQIWAEASTDVTWRWRHANGNKNREGEEKRKVWCFRRLICILQSTIMQYWEY